MAASMICLDELESSRRRFIAFLHSLVFIFLFSPAPVPSIPSSIPHSFRL